MKTFLFFVQFLCAWSMSFVWLSIVQYAGNAFLQHIFRVLCWAKTWPEEQTFYCVSSSTSFRQLIFWYLLFGMICFHWKFHICFFEKSYFEGWSRDVKLFLCVQCFSAIFWTVFPRNVSVSFHQRRWMKRLFCFAVVVLEIRFSWNTKRENVGALLSFKRSVGFGCFV